MQTSTQKTLALRAALLGPLYSEEAGMHMSPDLQPSTLCPPKVLCNLMLLLNNLSTFEDKDCRVNWYSENEASTVITSFLIYDDIVSYVGAPLSKQEIQIINNAV